MKSLLVCLCRIRVQYQHKEDLENTIFYASPELLELVRDLPGIRMGTICTADRVVSSDFVRKKLACEYQALCADWEGAATLEVCKLNGIPGLVFRVISDNAGAFARLQFLFHNRVAIIRGAAVLAQFIRTIPLTEG